MSSTSRSVVGVMLAHPRALLVRGAALDPRRPRSPEPPRVPLRVVRVPSPARVLVLLHRALPSPDGPVVLLPLPLPAARVVEDRDTREVDGAVAPRVVAPVLHVEHDPAALGVDDVPLVSGVELAVLVHDRDDPAAHRFAAVHHAVPVLEVDAVLGEEVRPGVPVLARGARPPVRDERLLELVPRPRRHGSTSLFSARAAIVELTRPRARGQV